MFYANMVGFRLALSLITSETTSSTSSSLVNWRWGKWWNCLCWWAVWSWSSELYVSWSTFLKIEWWHCQERPSKCFNLKLVKYYDCDNILQNENIDVLLRLRVQNRRKKWNFPPNFRKGIIWTAPFPLNIHNGIIWGGAFSKAFRSSEALISVLSKNARLYDNI